jgi:hypothetical protein
MKNNSFKAPQAPLRTSWSNNFTIRSKAQPIIKRSLANAKSMIGKVNGEFIGGSVSKGGYEY